MARKKLLSTLILLTLALSVLSALSANTTIVSAAAYPSLYVDPSSVEDIWSPNNFTVSVKTDYNGSDITGYELTLYYNPSVIHAVSATNGDLIVDGTSVFIPGTPDNTNGKITASAFFFAAVEPVPITSGPGTLATVTFTVVGIGDSPIILGTGIDETKLKGYTDGGNGDPYDIINGFTGDDHLADGYFHNELPIHDIAVVGVTPNDTEVVENDLVDIAVVVKNNGDVAETFDVSAYYDVYGLIGTQTVTSLAGGANTTKTFTLDTSGLSAATHSLRAEAETVLGETNTADNQLTSPQTVTVLPAITADISAPAEGYPGEPVTFNASGSVSQRGTIIEYLWDFGDGTVETVSDPVTSHIYKWNGVYAVWLWVFDDVGEVSVPDYQTMPIRDPPNYEANLVQWRAKPENHHWDESKDDNGKITVTALAKNTGTRAINITVIYTVLDARRGAPIDPVLSEDLIITTPGAKVPVAVEIDPYNYGYEGDAKVNLYVVVQLWYDADGNGSRETPASSKIVGIAVVP